MANTAIKPLTTEGPVKTSIRPMAWQVGGQHANIIINIVSANAWIEYESLVIKILHQINPKDASDVCENIFYGLPLATEDDKTQVTLFILGKLTFTGLSNTLREAIKNYIKIVLANNTNHVVLMNTGSFSEYDFSDPPQYTPGVKIVTVPHLTEVLFPRHGSLTK